MHTNFQICIIDSEVACIKIITVAALHINFYIGIGQRICDGVYSVASVSRGRIGQNSNSNVGIIYIY